ncbi:MAG: M50 family metallopeptidase [Alphaproteobacteria bacterium]|nr:M50 family metallopeptidase [Alphaproteobacteria bacterium]
MSTTLSHAGVGTMNRGTQHALIASVVVTFVLYQVPYGHEIGRPLVWLSTLAHELGHGITALLVGGRFGKLVMYADASGVAWTSASGAWREGLVAAGGLVGPAVVAALCFLAGRSDKGARFGLSLASAFLLVAAVAWVRNPFGIAFVTGLSLVLAMGAYRLPPAGSRFFVVFLGVQLSLSVFARSDYLFTPTARTAEGVMASDVAKMAEVLWLPYWFWGAACGAFSLVVLVFGLWVSLSGADTSASGRR